MTKRIYEKGQGVYYFAVYSVKGGEETLRWSDALDVDADMFKSIKKVVTDAQKKTADDNKKTSQNVDKLLKNLGPGTSSTNTTGTDRWIMLPDKRWVLQKPDNSLYKNTWALYAGKWYLFNAEGIMLSNGWQCVNKKWYYLDSSGALLVNTTTPDGCTVNEKGEWIQDGQAVVMPSVTQTKSASISSASTTKAAGTVTIGANESTRTVGMPKYLEVTASGATVANVSFSKPYEQWRSGDSIQVTVIILPKEGTYFASSTKFSVNKAFTQLSNNGGQDSRTLVLSYTPKIDLVQPSGFFMTSDNVLHWNKVEGATRYTLKITPEGEKAVTAETRSPEYDMSEYVFQNAKVAVTAAGPASSSTIKASSAFVINDLTQFAEGSQVEGYFTVKNGKPYYENEFGEKGGWKQIAGSWYHFKKNGSADGPGWFQDEDGNWYYFGPDYRMMTGIITDAGKQYAMNDGSNKSFPYGAWIH